MSDPQFAAAVDAFERLDPESQVQLADLLNRRLSERGRRAIVESVAEARREFADGKCIPVTADDLMREARS